jgi:O-acetyl-ADP-ribose deacetylase (regulator of RNase III)
MIEFVRGNLFDADVEAIVNAVNCVGVMGKGIALEFKKRFPSNFIAYKAACDAKELQLGHVFAFDQGPATNPRYIVNFPTKNHWRDSSCLEDIRTGLDSLAIEIDRRNISSIAIPALGCGLGGLDWHEVRSELETRLLSCKTSKIMIFEPYQPSPGNQSSHNGNFDVDSTKRTPDNS